MSKFEGLSETMASRPMALPRSCAIQVAGTCRFVRRERDQLSLRFVSLCVCACVCRSVPSHSFMPPPKESVGIIVQHCTRITLESLRLRLRLRIFPRPPAGTPRRVHSSRASAKSSITAHTGWEVKCTHMRLYTRGPAPSPRSSESRC